MAGALDGVRVLDLSRLLPGGFCSQLMADLGADVLKVEDTGMGDYVRWAPPYFEGAQESAKSSLFLGLNRGKRSIRVNLKTPEGRDVLLRLVRDADVLLESFRPGVLDRLGVGYERLRQENPGLVYCAITGYGQDGPYVDRSGHDMNYLGLNGVLALTGDGDGPPIQAGGQIADLGGGALMGAFGILAALRHRDRTGEGQLVDVSMFDGALSWLAMVAARVFAGGEQPRRGQEMLGGAVLCYRPYACKDGWVTLGALEPKFWQAWCTGVGPPRPDREAVRGAGLRGARRGRADLPRAHARRVAGVRLRARLLPGAGARGGGGAGVRARPRPRDGARVRAARRGPHQGPRVPGEALGDPGGGAGPRPGARRAHARGPARRRL